MANNLNLFLHIPKAAGTTLIQILNQIYKASSHYAYDTTKTEKNMRELEKLSKKQKQKIKLASGHFSFGFHNYFNSEDFKYFTILRNPSHRIVSHYYYSAKKTNHYLHELRKQRDISIKEYVISGITNEVNNGMAKQIAGLYVNDNFGYYDVNNQVISDSELFDRAIENIESHFSIVGFLEEFEKFLVLLQQDLQIPFINFKYTVKNQAERKPKILTNEELDIIHKYNQVDFKLYDYCIKNLNKKWGESKINRPINFSPNLWEHNFLKTKRLINKFI